MIKFTLHSFTVSHVIDDVMDLCDVISTFADHGLYNTVNPLSPIPVSSITQQQKKIKKKNNQISMEITDSLLVPVFTKLAQNPFSDQNESELKGWLDSLNAYALYNSPMEAATENASILWYKS